jgi:hypothetical protein
VKLGHGYLGLLVARLAEAMQAVVWVVPGLQAALVVGVMNVEGVVLTTAIRALETRGLENPEPLLLPQRVFKKFGVAAAAIDVGLRETGRLAVSHGPGYLL